MLMRTSLLAGAALAMAVSLALAAEKPKAKASTGSPNQITASELRTCLGLDNSSPDEQIAICTKVLKSGKVKPPHHSDYYATRAAAHLAKGDMKNAMADINTALEIRKAPEFYFQRGLINLAIREWDQSKSDFEKVISLKQTFTPAYFMRGLVSYQMADFQEAQGYFDRALQLTPTHYQSLYARGVIKVRLGDERGGKKDMADARGMSSRVEKDMAAFDIQAP